MNRQPQAGHAFILGNDTYSKLLKLLKLKRTSNQSSSDTETNVVAVVNDTGTDLELGDAVEITGPFVSDRTDDEFSSTDLFSIQEPAINATLIAILTEPIPDGEIWNAAIDGVATARINVTFTDHRFAYSSGGHQLDSEFLGPLQILEEPHSTGLNLYKCLFTHDAGQVAGTIRITANAAFTGASSTFQATVARSEVVGVSNGATVTVNNYCQKDGDLNAPGMAWAYADGEVDLIEVKCPENN